MQGQGGYGLWCGGVQGGSSWFSVLGTIWWILVRVTNQLSAIYHVEEVLELDTNLGHEVGWFLTTFSEEIVKLEKDVFYQKGIQTDHFGRNLIGWKKILYIIIKNPIFWWLWKEMVFWIRIQGSSLFKPCFLVILLHFFSYLSMLVTLEGEQSLRMEWIKYNFSSCLCIFMGTCLQI